MKNLLALFEITGNGSQPYREAGWNVVQVDIQAGIDILEWDYRQYAPDYFRGIIAFPPCTAYSLSGARWWAGKDAAGETEYFDSLVRRMLEIVEYFRPGLQFWYAENPVGSNAKQVAHNRLLPVQCMHFLHPISNAKDSLLSHQYQS